MTRRNTRSAPRPDWGRDQLDALAVIMATADRGNVAAARWLRRFAKTRAGIRPAIRWIRETGYTPGGGE